MKTGHFDLLTTSRDVRPESRLRRFRNMCRDIACKHPGNRIEVHVEMIQLEPPIFAVVVL
jgi:hypothetical protein